MDDLDTLTVEQLRTSLRAEIGRAAWIAAANRETCLSVLRGGPVPTMTVAAVHDAGKLAPAPVPPTPAEPIPPADVAGQIAALVAARLAPVVGPEAAAEAGQTAARAALAAVSPVVMGALFGAR
jgi:hypothetical protein